MSMTYPATVRARSIRADEIAALLKNTPAGGFRAFLPESDGTLTPAQCQVKHVRTAVLESEGLLTTRSARDVRVHDKPMGEQVSIECDDPFGRVHERVLFTEPEALRKYLEQRSRAAHNDVVLYVEDPEADEHPTTPVYGSEVTVSATVAGIDPGDLEARVTEALRREFGDSLRPRMKVRTRFVRDQRLIVVDPHNNDRPIAVDVLPSEVPAVMAAHGDTVGTIAMPADLL